MVKASLWTFGRNPAERESGHTSAPPLSASCEANGLRLYLQASIDAPLLGMKSVANHTLAVFPPTTTAWMPFGFVNGLITASPGSFFQLAYGSSPCAPSGPSMLETIEFPQYDPAVFSTF